MCAIFILIYNVSLFIICFTILLNATFAGENPLSVTGNNSPGSLIQFQFETTFLSDSGFSQSENWKHLSFHL